MDFDKHGLRNKQGLKTKRLKWILIKVEAGINLEVGKYL